nr:hypothetical protein [Oryctes rhinoceros nudivirus]
MRTIFIAHHYHNHYVWAKMLVDKISKRNTARAHIKALFSRISLPLSILYCTFRACHNFNIYNNVMVDTCYQSVIDRLFESMGGTTLI